MHITCSLWIPELDISYEKKEGANFKLINPKRYKLKCEVCRVGGKCCVQCANKYCTASFHVECARNAGYYLTKLEGKGRLVYCSAHDPRRVRLKLQEEAALSYKEIMKFAMITKNCLKKVTLKKTFHKMNQKILIKRIRKLYGRYVSRDRAEELYERLLSERYLWETLKFGGFTGQQCYQKFALMFPDFAEFCKQDRKSVV